MLQSQHTQYQWYPRWNALRFNATSLGQETIGSSSLKLGYDVELASVQIRLSSGNHLLCLKAMLRSWLNSRGEDHMVILLAFGSKIQIDQRNRRIHWEEAPAGRVAGEELELLYGVKRFRGSLG